MFRDHQLAASSLSARAGQGEGPDGESGAAIGRPSPRSEERPSRGCCSSGRQRAGAALGAIDMREHASGRDLSNRSVVGSDLNLPPPVVERFLVILCPNRRHQTPDHHPRSGLRPSIVARHQPAWIDPRPLPCSSRVAAGPGAAQYLGTGRSLGVLEVRRPAASRRRVTSVVPPQRLQLVRAADRDNRRGLAGGRRAARRHASLAARRDFESAAGDAASQERRRQGHELRADRRRGRARSLSCGSDSVAEKACGNMTPCRA